MNNLKYVILPASEIGDIVFSEVKEDSAGTLGLSIDESKTFVKYEGAKPRFLYGKDTHTHSEILVILNTPEWSQNPVNED